MTKQPAVIDSPVRAPFTWLVVFALAMGYLESSVVVYLREIYYPDGFKLPLHTIDTHLALTEIVREAATMVMILSVALLTFRRKNSRFGAFLFIFACWDISYYAFLKLLIGWPGSFFTWDILFLIPITWTGPVIAPIINSVTMAILGIILISCTEKRGRLSISSYEWALLITGSVITIVGYTMDYTTYLLQSFSFGDLISLPLDEGLMDYASEFIPDRFNWFLFISGEVYFLLAIISYLKRIEKSPL